MASPMLCLRSPFSEMLSSYYQLRVMRTSLRARDKKRQSYNPYKINQRARISTISRDEAKQREGNNAMSSKPPNVPVRSATAGPGSTSPPAQPVTSDINAHHQSSENEEAQAFADALPQGDTSIQNPRLPRSVQAVFLRPLKRTAHYGYPCCDLQLRSYSARNVEFFADFALRAAYYLHLPAAGPIPLPRITERWTVPRSNFVFKKSQENFERITMRRLIQIQDGHPESVEVWLAFLRKHAYHGVGMKANVWQQEKLGVGKTMDVSLENLKQAMQPKWAHFGRRKTLETSERAYEMMKDPAFQQSQEAPQIGV